MGWTYSHRNSFTPIKKFVAEYFGSDNVVDIKIVNLREAYVACKSEDSVVAFVCLLDYDKKSYYNTGIKIMDETMQPYYYNCPQSILNLLTLTNNDSAITWRNKCIENIIKLTSFKEALVNGTVFHFENGVSFGVYGKAFTFTCTDAKKLHFFAREIGINVKLNKNFFLNHNYTIVK